MVADIYAAFSSSTFLCFSHYKKDLRSVSARDFAKSNKVAYCCWYYFFFPPTVSICETYISIPIKGIEIQHVSYRF